MENENMENPEMEMKDVEIENEMDSENANDNSNDEDNTDITEAEDVEAVEGEAEGAVNYGTFKELGLSKDILDVLDEMKIVEPTEVQYKAIPLALAGKDIIGGSATGSGKTLAFATPIIENLKQLSGSDARKGNVQALIMTPTRELAEQVADSIKQFSRGKRLNVLAVYGGVSIDNQIRKMSTADIVVGTPGRILDHLNRTTLELGNVKFLVLDEVDRMFDMGFHRDVENIINQCPRERQTMLFSATISSDIDHLAKLYTKDAAEVAVESYIDASKLKQSYYDVSSGVKFSLLVHLLKKEDSELVMVFCSTRRNVDFIAKNLTKVGIDAKAIHGGLNQNQRNRVLRDFHGKGVTVLVCTDVAARGLDIKGVSHVYNYDLPKTSQDYVHRIGRTARAGEEGKAVSILSSRDYDNFSNVLRDDSLKIAKEELPKFETIMVRMDSGRSGGRFGGGSRSGGRSSGGRSSGGSGGRRYGGGSSRGPSRGGSSSGGSSSSGRRYGNSGRSEGSRTGGRSSSGGSSSGRSAGRSGGSRFGSRSSGGRYGSNRSSAGGSSRGGSKDGFRGGGRGGRSSSSSSSRGGRSSSGARSFGRR
jgi:superfamily II DNA/RNA helicase